MALNKLKIGGNRGFLKEFYRDLDRWEQATTYQELLSLMVKTGVRTGRMKRGRTQ